jgi:asparagine synthase (glutamine-hydrolysing)
LGYRYSGSGVSEGEGVWAEWNWDGRQLTVRNDRFGFLPVYYAQLPSGFGVSTSALELIRAGAATDLDDAAVAVFVRLGYYIGNDTPFKSVRLLPAGSELTWSDGAPAIKHWHHRSLKPFQR